MPQHLPQHLPQLQQSLIPRAVFLQQLQGSPPSQKHSQHCGQTAALGVRSKGQEETCRPNVSALHPCRCRSTRRGQRNTRNTHRGLTSKPSRQPMGAASPPTPPPTRAPRHRTTPRSCGVAYRAAATRRTSCAPRARSRTRAGSRDGSSKHEPLQPGPGAQPPPGTAPRAARSRPAPVRRRPASGLGRAGREARPRVGARSCRQRCARNCR